MAQNNIPNRNDRLKEKLKNKNSKVKAQASDNTELDTISSVTSIDPQLKELKEHYESLLNAHRRTINASIEFGAYLSKVKDTVGHGHFIDHIEKNKSYLGFDRRAASNYLRIYNGQHFIRKESKTIQDAINDIRIATAGLPEPEFERKLEREINPLEYDSTKAKKLYKLFIKNGKVKKGIKKPVADYIRKFIENEMEKEKKKYENIIAGYQNDLSILN
ncbi:hypothetical protein LFX25_20510 [Leptospira sp. FAT2]|uniref:hypothetical protein n=1 Tax=Leptospira sanjuanensis TaxID=2879643 RepID=UPI001EE81553|nr:hypothetical protein [Leptospira sanjuanensis]MCG6195629.1 hypothetical protein [Leptospira sanjuanensis]